METILEGRELVAVIMMVSANSSNQPNEETCGNRSRQAQQELQQMMDTIINAEFMKGVQQGFAQGEARGRLVTRREDLIDLLTSKFAAHVNESIFQHILSVNDPDALDRWFRAAVATKSWKQFIKAVNWPPSS